MGKLNRVKLSTLTKSQVLWQVRYNLKVENMKRKNLGQKKLSKLDKVFYWNDFVEGLHRNNDILDSQVNNWTNPFEYRQ